MKKYLPIILPIAALALVAFLGMRWYRSRELTEVSMPEVASSAPINPMTNDDRATLDRLAQGLGDYQAVNLDAAGHNAVGEIRYQIVDDRVLFSVNANLDTTTGTQYHVFIKTADSDQAQDIGTLADTKGGLIASHSLSVNSLPLTVEIRDGENVILTGTINPPEASISETDNLPLDNQESQE